MYWISSSEKFVKKDNFKNLNKKLKKKKPQKPQKTKQNKTNSNSQAIIYWKSFFTK